MGRWEPDARGRLAKAALELYLERGFDQTTVTEIAQRAGLTERTFFRHFADKREVLFAGNDEFEKAVVGAIDGAPEAAAPIDAVAAALDAAAGVIWEVRDTALLRQAVIVANQELRERELTKLAAISATLTDALRRRGTGDPAAALTAEVGVAVFKAAYERWVEEKGARPLPDVLRDSFHDLKTVTAGRTAWG